MSTRTERPRIAFDNNEPGLAGDLFARLSGIQETSPAAWSDVGEGFWLLTKHEDIAHAAHDWESFTVTQGITFPETGKSVQLPLTEMDPPIHSHFRKLVLPHFTPRALEAWADTIRTIVEAAFAPLLARGSGDLVAEVACRIPSSAISAILGIDSDWQLVSQLSDDFLSTTGDVANRERAIAAGHALEEFLHRQIHARRTGPPTDLLGRIMHAEVMGRSLTDAEILGLCIVFFVAGHGTTTDGIGSTVHRVLTEPGLLERLRSDRSILPAVVEESLRLSPPVWNMGRTVAAPVDVQGVSLRTGEKVMLAYGAANRDPDTFAEPDRFDPDRDRVSQHQSFGTGRHRCVGEALAKLEIRLVIEYLLDHAPDMEVGGDVVWRTRMSTYGPESLPLRCAPRAR